MKIAQKIAAALLAAGLAGCSSGPTLPPAPRVREVREQQSLTERIKQTDAEDAAKHYLQMQKHELLTPEKNTDSRGNKIDFKSIRGEYLNGLKGIRVVPKEEMGGTGVLADYHPLDRTICLTETGESRYVMHELIHHQLAKLGEKKTYLLERWRLTDGQPYGWEDENSLVKRNHVIEAGKTRGTDYEWKDGGNGPQRNSPSPYSRTSPEEHICEIAEILSYEETPDEAMQTIKNLTIAFIKGGASFDEYQRNLEKCLSLQRQLYPAYFVERHPSLELVKILRGVLTEADYKTMEENIGVFSELPNETTKLVEHLFQRFAADAVQAR